VAWALAGGAIGYLLKSSPATTLVDNMVHCARGSGVISGEAMAALMSSERPDPTLLTARQLEVLSLSAAGHTRDQIAAQLHISTATVKSHLSCIYERLGASNSREAAHLAREAGLLN
jgi:DNA-binding NarL/FixJ family response regulator